MKIRLIAAGSIASLVLAGCATSPGYNNGSYGNNGGYDNGGYTSNRCTDCGTVTRITVGGESGKAGAVIGGIIGAVAGHEISAQTGGSKGNQNISAAAGAVAGAAAGNAIQKNRSDGYTVHVRMDDGRTTAVTQGDVSGFREGSRVRVSDGRAYLQ